jgi:hypothetical protein
MEFGLKLKSSSEEVELSATKAPVAESSSKTDLLCRTWQLVKENGETVPSGAKATVLFTNSGTYFLQYSYEDDIEEGSGQWKWKDSKENTICYAFSDEESSVTCDGDNELTVTTLSSSKLVITYSDGEETYTEEYKAVTY